MTRAGSTWENAEGEGCSIKPLPCLPPPPAVYCCYYCSYRLLHFPPVRTVRAVMYESNDRPALRATEAVYEGGGNG